LRESDPTLNELGYTTDNGAYYYYHAEGDGGGKWEPGADEDMAPTLSALKKDFDARALPVRYWLADSWWYLKDPYGAGGGGGGVVSWTALEPVFPGGLEAVRADTNLTVMGHNRMWSPGTTYAVANGGAYTFEHDTARNDSFAMPTEQVRAVRRRSVAFSCTATHH
jgi:hypothetical protein